MTLLEGLKKLFGSKLDEELETVLSNEETTLSNKEVNNKSDSDTNNEKVEQVKKEEAKPTGTDEKSEMQEVVDKVVKEGEEVEIFENGWYDVTTGKVDFGKIKNKEVLEAIQTLYTTYQNEKSQRVISDSIREELKNYTLNVTEDTLRKVMDLKDVKIGEDGKVLGVKEAIEQVKTKEPNFFKNVKTESNPINEGFNPVEKRDTILTEDELISMAYGQSE